MSEQMFNIPTQFHVKLALPLCHCVLESLCYAFVFTPLRLCVESLGLHFPALPSHIPAVHWRLRRSGSTFARSRRLCFKTVARPRVLAVRCGAKVAIRWRAPAFPPRASAAVVQILPIRAANKKQDVP